MLAKVVEEMAQVEVAWVMEVVWVVVAWVMEVMVVVAVMAVAD